MKSPIPLPRFSLKTLFIAVLGVAIAVAALRFPNPLLASTLFTLLLVVLFAGFLGAVFGRGERRVFCAGLVLSGLGYLTAVYGPWFESHVSGHLATTHLLVVVGDYDGDGWVDVDLLRVGHSLFGLLLALFGGALARWIWLKGREAGGVDGPAAVAGLHGRTLDTRNA